jgi:RNA recognition motif-containing protein
VSSVFVSNLPSTYSEKDLTDIFKDAGLKPQKAKLLFDNDGKSKCAGFVDFGNPKDTAEAVKQCNNMNMSEGKRLNVAVANK